MHIDYTKEIGNKYGRLTLLSILPDHKAKFLCKCDCGNETTALLGTMKTGHKLSCGCLQKEKAKISVLAYNNSGNYKLQHSRKTHGMSETRLYTEWLSMKNRCKLKSQSSYILYGGRGITVCDEWLSGFEPFMEWAINNGYNDNLQIDRIDNEKGYSPDNCRWVTKREQINNRRKTVYLEYDGERLPISIWAEKLGVKRYTLYNKRKQGIPDEEIIRRAKRGDYSIQKQGG